MKVRQIQDQATMYATGKKKNAIAKIWIKENNKKGIYVNGEKYIKHFSRKSQQAIIIKPFKKLSLTLDQYNVKCYVYGGGASSQAVAIQHGISKIINTIKKEFYEILKNYHLLTRDSRQVERKKYGQPKARKKFQFSKR